MRLTVIDKIGGGTGVAVVDGDVVTDISNVDQLFSSDLMPVVAAGKEGLRAAAAAVESGRRLDPASIKWALPLARPSKIVCLGLNYLDHAKEGGYDVPDYPSLFYRTVESLVPCGQPMERPLCSERFDYEAELMVVIGTGGRHIAEKNALRHVFGYTVFNDGSVRDYQRKTTQWGPGKNFDRSGSIGPDVVTADELAPGAAGLRIQSRLNGTVLQDADTADMMFPVSVAIAAISEYCTLNVGDLIAMGTPPGVGHARKPPVWMRPGDTIQIEIEKIGRLSNPIIDEQSSSAPMVGAK